MTNSKFWKSYVAKCSEKGLPPLYKNAEEFNKAMTELPKPYSTDDFTPSKDESTQDNDDDFEHMLYLMQQSSGFVEEEYLETVEDNTQKANDVKPIVCVCCQESKSPDAFGTLRNKELRKICKVCHGKSISKARSKNKETVAVEEIPSVQADHSVQALVKKEFKEAVESSPKEVGKVAIMELTVFHSALAMAYERGIAEGKAFADLTITEVELPVILDEVLGARV